MKLTLFIASLLATTVFAGADPTSDKVYKELDRNHDGKVTAQEFTDEIVILAFINQDANHDGKVDQAEWAKTEKGAAGKKSFAALDTNKDGVLDQKESTQNPAVRAVLIRIFGTLDPNHDGVLTVQEVPANQKKN